ncbi:F-box/LRR-repeat protein 4-like isoform X2 [Lineus longissimus]|uniref:F-box/LRR-repeat protein 4-like isoform X2 n=1 Tax=Lineus longissimus TaxID=88925 RepID=UPI00315DEAC5
MASQISSQQKSPDILDQEFEQFASEVVDFSSQYAGEIGLSYSAKNLAGASEIYPKYGDFTQACVLRTYGPWWKLAPSYAGQIPRVPSKFVSQDYIDLSFDTPVIPTKIEIYETYNPGAVSRIVACISPEQSGNGDKKLWMTLWSGQPKPVPRRSRIFSPSLALIPYPVKFLRLEFCCTLCDYYTELDAVKLTGKRCSDEYISKIIKILNKERDVLSLDEHQESMSGMMQWLSLGSGSSDPPEGYFSLLPEEVIQKIFSFLDLRTLCKIVSTCKLFQKHAYDPLHFTVVNAQPYWATMSDNGLDSLHSRCKLLRRLSLSWCGNYGHITQDGLNRFLRVCGMMVTDLRLACCKFVDDKVLKTIVECCPKLREIDLHSCPISDWTPLLSVNLTRLNLYRSQIDGDSLKKILSVNHDLEHLNIGCCTFIQNYDEITATLAKHCIGNIRSGSGCLVKLAKTSGRNLRKLYLTANRTVADQDLKALADNCPNLEQLDILGTGEVKAALVERVLENCTQLKFFDVSFCAAVDFAMLQGLRDQFPNVDIKKSFQ